MPTLPTNLLCTLLCTGYQSCLWHFHINVTCRKKIANRFEQFWVEICLKNFVCKIQNPGQITRPSINLKVVLKKKSGKDFKKVGPICGYLSFKSQLTKVCAVLSWNYRQRRQFFSVKLMWKSHKKLWYLVQSSVLCPFGHLNF